MEGTIEASVTCQPGEFFDNGKCDACGEDEYTLTSLADECIACPEHGLECLGEGKDQKLTLEAGYWFVAVNGHAAHDTRRRRRRLIGKAGYNHLEVDTYECPFGF